MSEFATQIDAIVGGTNITVSSVGIQGPNGSVSSVNSPLSLTNGVLSISNVVTGSASDLAFISGNQIGLWSSYENTTGYLVQRNTGGNIKATSASFYSGVVISNKPALDISQIWNNVSADYSAVRINVIDSGSADGSDILELQKNGAPMFSFDENGDVIIESTFRYLRWRNKCRMTSPSDGNLVITNNASADFTSLMLGGTTSSYPAIRRQSNGIKVILADNSQRSFVEAARFVANLGTLTNVGQNLTTFDSQSTWSGAGVTFDGFIISNDVYAANANSKRFTIRENTELDYFTVYRDGNITGRNSLTLGTGLYSHTITGSVISGLGITGTNVSGHNLRCNTLSVSGYNISAKKELIIAVGDEVTELVAGTSLVTFRMPYAMSLIKVKGSLTSGSSSGDVVADITEEGSSIFSSNLTIDQGSKTSVGSASPYTISDSLLADDAEIKIDVDSNGVGAAGLKITLIGYEV